MTARGRATLCPACDRETRTVSGLCPHCGQLKDDAGVPPGIKPVERRMRQSFSDMFGEAGPIVEALVYGVGVAALALAFWLAGALVGLAVLVVLVVLVAILAFLLAGSGLA